MFSKQQDSGLKDKITKSDVVNSKSKLSRAEITQEIKKTLKEDYDNTIRPNVGTEFKIFAGSQEYKIRRFSDVYIVKPCSSKQSLVEIKPSTLGFRKTECRACTSKEAKRETTDTSFNELKPTKATRISQKRPQSTASTNTASSRASVTQQKPVWKENTALSRKSREFFNSVNQALKLQKVFMIGNNNKRAFPNIREALTARGWVEKCSADVLSEEEVINPKTAEITTRLLKDAPVNFVWVTNAIDFGNVKYETVVSRFPKNSHFTTKVGLCRFLNDIHWFYEPNISQTVFPKTFNIANGDDIDNFIKEFGLMACVGLLKIVVNEVVSAESDSFFKNGEVPLSVIDFANAQCSEYILYRSHEDIDRQEDYQVTPREWTDFLAWFYKIAHNKGSFQTTSYPMIQAIYSMCKMNLKNIEPFWPQMDLEGCKNMWVVKPAANFCGRGVKVMTNLDDIIDHLDVPADNKTYRHIVQKYIEHPLLIHNTKFDIRQWFLVTSVYPLTIWIYKECYLRFSSQPFSLDNLHERIHLTNNAIQRNYNIHEDRHKKLPQENMWHCTTFQEYLNDIGEPGKWCTVILPGIKQGIVGTLLASQDEMVDRLNSFELYGADFLLGKDYTPVLLEINMGPSMAPSTNITADLCKRGLQDIIKVVLDRKYNPNADTGGFEILYKQEMGPRRSHVGVDLMVTGTRIVPERKPKQM